MSRGDVSQGVHKKNGDVVALKFLEHASEKWAKDQVSFIAGLQNMRCGC